MHYLSLDKYSSDVPKRCPIQLYAFHDKYKREKKINKKEEKKTAHVYIRPKCLFMRVTRLFSIMYVAIKRRHIAQDGMCVFVKTVKSI